MRALSKQEWWTVAAGVAIVALVGYHGAVMLSGNADLTAPPQQPRPVDFDAQARLGMMTAPDGYSKLCAPEDHHGGYVYTPHRYPRTVGGEVTNTIHRGFSSMRIPNVQDVQWIMSPPSEAAW